MSAVLCVNYYFPPIKSVAVIRNYNIGKAFQKKYSDVYVLTTSNRKLLAQELLPLNGFHVFPAQTIDYRTIFNFLSKNKKTHFSANEKGRWSRLFFKIHMSFPFNLLTGEGGLAYIFNSYRNAVQLIRENKITTLYSSFMPYSDHFVAYLLKRKFPHLYWIADFRDLHIDPIRQITFFNAFQKWCNQQILAKANLITTVSNGLANHLKPFNANTKVVRNGIPMSQKINISWPRNKKFTISYTGSVYKNLRTPELLLVALKELIAEEKIDQQKIQIVYAGKDSSAWQNWMKKYKISAVFLDKGMVSHEAARQIQESSDCNLLLSWASPELTGVLTGKFYEYLVANRPIINLINGSKDPEFEQVFESLKAGRVFYNQEVLTLKKHLWELYMKWERNGFIAGEITPEKLKPFYWNAMAKDLFDHIKKDFR